MPFKSKAQRKFLWARHPKIARKWTKEHGSGGKKLPEHVASMGVMDVVDAVDKTNRKWNPVHVLHPDNVIHRGISKLFGRSRKERYQDRDQRGRFASMHYGPLKTRKQRVMAALALSHLLSESTMSRRERYHTRLGGASMGIMPTLVGGAIGYLTGGRGKDEHGRSLTGGGRVRDTEENRAITEKHGAHKIGGIGERPKRDQQGRFASLASRKQRYQASLGR